jgi:WD repeat-containing protein 22
MLTNHFFKFVFFYFFFYSDLQILLWDFYQEDVREPIGSFVGPRVRVITLVLSQLTVFVVSEQRSSLDVLALEPILVLVSLLMLGMYVIYATLPFRGGIDDVIFRYDVSYLGSSRAQIAKRAPDATCTYHDVSITCTPLV